MQSSWGSVLYRQFKKPLLTLVSIALLAFTFHAVAEPVFAASKSTKKTTTSKSKSKKKAKSSSKKGKCDPNYSGCVPIAKDVDCKPGKGNGPKYTTGPKKVLKKDIYKLDTDKDGIACEKN